MTVISVLPLKKDLRMPSARTSSVITQSFQWRAPGNLPSRVKSCRKRDQERRESDQDHFFPDDDDWQKSDVIDIRGQINPMPLGDHPVDPHAGKDSHYRTDRTHAHSDEAEQLKTLSRSEPHRFQNRDLLGLVMDHHHESADDI